MNIAFLLGNGFDVSLGLDTRYRDFYRWYSKIEVKDSILNHIKTSMLSAPKEWSDLELKLGNITSESFGNTPDDVSRFLAVYNDIHSKLCSYIGGQNNRVQIDDPGKTAQEFVARLLNFTNFLPTRGQIELAISPNSILNINLWIFNYTTIVDRILKEKPFILRRDFYDSHSLRVVHNHIHGYLNGDVLVGVNDIKQITNESFSKNSDLVSYFVKPKTNEALGNQLEKAFSSSIKQADIYVVFGMSFGKTDKIRWEQIIDQLIANPNKRLVAFFYEEKYNPAISVQFLKNELEKKLLILSHKEMNSDSKDKLLNQIYISFNCNMFKRLPIKIESTDNK